MIQKNRGVGAALFLAVLLSIGCSSDGVFDNPDSIRATTLAAIHGSRGHRIDINIGPNNADPDDTGMTKQAVLALHDPDVSAHTLYLVIETNSISIGRMIDLLEDATEVAIVPDLPEDTQPWTRMVLTLGGEGGDPFSGYLRVSAPSETAYLSLRGTVTEEKRAWFLREVSKPPEVLDTMPVRVVEINYYLDPHFTEPITGTVYVGDTVYTKVVFSKAPPVVVANGGDALPHLSSTSRSGEFQYRIREPGAPLRSGDASLYRGTDHVFICKYVVRDELFTGTFRTHANYGAVSGDTLQVRFFEYTGGIPANVGETIGTWGSTDFVGQVYTLRITDVQGIRERSYNYSRDHPSVPVPGATVTIASGPRHGEHIVTDRNGRYRFLNVAGDTLHLRVERHRFEPKEVLVHRSRPTALANGVVPNYPGDPQRKPGNILIGLVWPEKAREFLEYTLVVHDLLYFDAGSIPMHGIGGFYGSGIVVVFASQSINWGSPLNVLKLFIHEIMHAHQDAMVSVDGSGHIDDWENTPEGRAFAAAREKDVAEMHTFSYDRGSYYNRSIENAAAVVQECWAYEQQLEGVVLVSDGRGERRVPELIPNRYQWYKEWIMKK